MGRGRIGSPVIGAARGGGLWRNYRVAGCMVAIDRVMVDLGPYAAAGPTDGGPAAPALALLPARPADPAAARDVAGLVGGALRQVAVWHEAAGSWLAVPGVVDLWVAADGSAIHVATGTEAPHAPADSLLAECVVGPGVVLALACQGIFCLHASAVEWAGGAVAFVGDSGSGKSTLAALLAQVADPVGPRLADDILPVECAAAGATARPDFPQLKLAVDRQWRPGAGQQAGFPLAAVYKLAGAAAAAPDGVTVQAVSPHAAAMVLLSHAVANRLFPEAMARRHFHDLVALAGYVPVRTLAYPRRPDIGPAVAAAIAADLGAERGIA